ncbi:hypothetical protein [Oceanobacillus neutriphilus]|uniref:CXXC-20-CXXC protein n=1 Tax=Oceanobacillus neutriphilus TaxID=531815 RepID=A0ABQ2NS42_9BACI|nr:hypothetical protein [Oceanobacillus neutriphilus]GGP09110.1 hypothetical protein GCM10011346_11850 [Oceanobacillus neutriphilus]
MTVCRNCGKRWGLFKTYKIVFANDGVECPNCGKKQYLSGSSLINLLFGSTVIIFFILVPFLVKLSNEEEQIY